MIQIKISNNIEVIGATEKVIDTITKTLTIPNPKYYQLMRATGNRARAFWGTPKEFKYYRQSDNILSIPRGFRTRLLNWLDKIKIEYSITEEFVNMDATFKSSIQLRDYQITLVEKALKHKEGIIVSSTGSGKTLMFLEIAARIGKTTTILTPNTVIQDQFVGDVRKYLGIEPGIICANSKTINSLTISTWQSLQSNKDLCHRLADNTSVLLIDEAQCVPTDNKIEILEMFKPSYLYGTTATLGREDGKAPAVKFYLGEELCNFEMASLSPTIEVVRTNEPIQVDEYHDMIQELIENENRNVLITGMTVGEAMSGRKVLVLTKRVAHAEHLFSKLPKEWQNTVVFLISSDDKDRNTLLGQFKRSEKDFRVIIGTTSLLSVGTDIPSLDVLIMACDMKSQVLTHQSCGRILRLFEGKKDPKIIDICDNGNPILWRQYKARERFYRSKNWTITGI